MYIGTASHPATERGEAREVTAQRREDRCSNS